MGTYLADIETFDELEKFSTDVDEVTINATVSTLTEKFKNELINENKPNVPNAPFQIILAGGDDLILALPANKAVDVAIDFCKKFEKKLRTRDITTSASIVICHDSFPIKNVLNIAESLIKNAKSESRINNGQSYLDFIVITGSSLEEPIAKREKELQYHKRFGSHYLTKRPYSLTEMENLITTIQELKKSEFPNNKLKALYTSLFKGHIQSVMDAQYLKMRLKEEHKLVLNEFLSESQLNFPWEKDGDYIYKTSIGDIVELYKFIEVD